MLAGMRKWHIPSNGTNLSLNSSDLFSNHIQDLQARPPRMITHSLNYELKGSVRFLPSSLKQQRG